jgi:hypothetical protein
MTGLTPAPFSDLNSLEIPYVSVPAHWAMTELSGSRCPGPYSRRACVDCRALVTATPRSAVAHGCLFDWIIRVSNL